MKSKCKSVLITAGPTWAPIDSVRVISNISTGETGVLLSKEALRRRYRTTLLLGPIGSTKISSKINLIRFRYFKELQDRLHTQLYKKKFDLILHLAAVSDYELVKRSRFKMSSKRKRITLKLKKTEKIITLCKQIQPEAILVLFKLEDSYSWRAIKKTLKALDESKADLAVLNVMYDYVAHIMTKNRRLAKVKSKQRLAEKLFDIVGEKIRK